MTNALKVQKLFIKLSANQRKRSGLFPGYIRRNNPWNKKFPRPNKVRLEIINAVTGERTIAYSFDDSKRALKKWLRLRNLRAQFDNMTLKPNSSWFNFMESEWSNFPVIVKVDDFEVPYLIDHVGEKITIKNKTTCSVFLKTTNNFDYLGVVSAKKKLMKDWIANHPIKFKKKRKRKKKKWDFDFDD